MLNISEPLPRPNRLNPAGWCCICGAWRCESADCIQQHESTFWGLCDECHGSQNLRTKGWCTCTAGLVEYASRDAAVHSYDDLAAAIVRQEAWDFTVVA